MRHAFRDMIARRFDNGGVMPGKISAHVVSGDYSPAHALLCAARRALVLMSLRRTEEMRKIGGAAPAPGGTTLGSGRLARSGPQNLTDLIAVFA